MQTKQFCSVGTVFASINLFISLREEVGFQSNSNALNTHNPKGGFKQMFVYVLNKDKKPLMPTNPTVARLLLKDGKAKVVSKMPFTIKLVNDSTEYVQEVVAGMDTGSKIIGSSAIANGKVVYQAEIQIRQNVSCKMQQRSMFRKSRRSRKTRYRQPRWSNRASMKRKGRLAPSLKSKVDSHLREKLFIESRLPVSYWNVELASFDINKITDPEVSGTGYQDGLLKGYYNLKAFILDRDGHACQKCKSKKTKLHVHHIKFRSNGGTDTPDNLITLCESCHKKLHASEFSFKPKRSKTKHATEMGIIKSQLKKRFGGFNETFGYETKFKREQILHLPKEHYYDAVAICCIDGEVVDFSNIIYIKRHIPKGDYKQTRGHHSQHRIPTGKLFGLRKFDFIKTTRGTGYIRSKRVTGIFDIFQQDSPDVYGILVKRNCQRITARTTTLVQLKRMLHPAA
jgi:5-methylcytosine-specific restriction endonuclease McrA